MVGHININRLRHKTHHVQEIIDQHQLAILCGSETWLDCNITDCEVSIPDYRLFYTACFVTIGKTRKEGVYVFSFISLLLQINYP